MRERSSSSTSSSKSGRAGTFRSFREALGFLALVLGCFLAVAGLWLGINLARRDVRIDNGPAMQSCDFLAFKRGLVERTPGQRVLVVGLSNVLMGIRADEIGDALGRHVLNYGLVATVTTGMVFEATERVVRRGDIVVLSLPYWFYQPETTLLRQRPVVRDLVFSCPTQGYFRLPFRYQLEFLLQQNVGQVFEAFGRKGSRAVGMPELWKEPELAWHLKLESEGGVFTPTGDYQANRRQDRRPKHLERLRDLPLPMATYAVDEADDSVRSLREFARLARTLEVTVVAVWPPAWVMKGDHGSIVDDLRELYGDLGIPVVGDPEEFFYEADAFYDTPNHLTREAASIYSSRVAELIKPLLDSRLPRDTPPVPMH